MAVREILKLGDPALYEVSDSIHESEFEKIKEVVEDLHDTLIDFREEHGIGRAIAAPQIGVRKRLIYMNIDEPVVFINPSFKTLSAETMEVWDDCMCFPGFEVKVRRHESCVIRYRDMNWEWQEMELEGDLAELLQHEYDHLDGILATQRALDKKSFRIKSRS